MIGELLALNHENEKLEKEIATLKAAARKIVKESEYVTTSNGQHGFWNALIELKEALSDESGGNVIQDKS